MRSTSRRRFHPANIAVFTALVLVTTALGQIAGANTSTVRKYNASISPTCVAPGSRMQYTATLKNDPSTTKGQYITSAFFHNPSRTGLSNIGSFSTPVASNGKHWSVLPDTFDADGFTLVAKSPTSTNALKPNESVTVTWMGTAAASGSTKFSTLIVGSGSFTLVGGTPTVSFTNQCPATHFAVTDTGGNAIGTQAAGVAFDVKVSALDANEHVAAGFSGTALLTSNGALASSPVSVPIVAGVSSPNPSVTITNSGTFKLTAASGSLTGSSNDFLVQGGTATHFTVEAAGGGPVGDQIAGTAFSIQVFARDASENVAIGYTGTATVTSDGTLLGGPVNVSVVNGVSDPFDITITNASPPNFNLSADDGNGVAGGSNAFAVAAGQATHLVVEADGGGDIGQQASGVAFLIQIRALDDNGNVDTNFTGSATISSTGNLTDGSSTGPFINGEITGHSVTITDTGTFSLTAMSGIQGTSNDFLVADAALGCDAVGTPGAELSKSGDAGDADLALTQAGPNCPGSIPVTVDLTQPGFVTITKPDVVGALYSLTVDWTLDPNVPPPYPLQTEVDTGSGFVLMVFCDPGPTIPDGQLWCITDSHSFVDDSGTHLRETYIGTLDVTFKRHP
jgi:hypothetical protein